MHILGNYSAAVTMTHKNTMPCLYFLSCVLLCVSIQCWPRYSVGLYKLLHRISDLKVSVDSNLVPRSSYSRLISWTFCAHMKKINAIRIAKQLLYWGGRDSNENISFLRHIQIYKASPSPQVSLSCQNPQLKWCLNRTSPFCNLICSTWVLKLKEYDVYQHIMVLVHYIDFYYGFSQFAIIAKETTGTDFWLFIVGNICRKYVGMAPEHALYNLKKNPYTHKRIHTVANYKHCL